MLSSPCTARCSLTAASARRAAAASSRTQRPPTWTSDAAGLEGSVDHVSSTAVPSTSTLQDTSAVRPRRPLGVWSAGSRSRHRRGAPGQRRRDEHLDRPRRPNRHIASSSAAAPSTWSSATPRPSRAAVLADAPPTPPSSSPVDLGRKQREVRRHRRRAASASARRGRHVPGGAPAVRRAHVDELDLERPRRAGSSGKRQPQPAGDDGLAAAAPGDPIERGANSRATRARSDRGGWRAVDGRRAACAPPSRHERPHRGSAGGRPARRRRAATNPPPSRRSSCRCRPPLPVRRCRSPPAGASSSSRSSAATPVGRAPVPTASGRRRAPDRRRARSARTSARPGRRRRGRRTSAPTATRPAASGSSSRTDGGRR